MNAILYWPHITNDPDTSFDQGRTLVWLLGNHPFHATPQYLSLRCLNSLLLLRSFWKWKIVPPKMQVKGPIATVAVHLHLLWTLKVKLQTSESFKNKVRESFVVTEWGLVHWYDLICPHAAPVKPVSAQAAMLRKVLKQEMKKLDGSQDRTHYH